MARILVGSVYGSSDRNATWYALQRRFLDACADEYELAVFLNGAVPAEFSGATVIGTAPPEVAPRGSVQHERGLAAIMGFFVERTGFDGYLILDSDAFPIVRDWRARLATRMAGTERLPERAIAAVVRTENLDVFPHPCVAYFTPSGLQSATSTGVATWSRSPTRNLLGQVIPDVAFTAGLASNGGEQRLLPLLRTNAINPHPVLAAVYDDLFYHHGAGSREPQFRRTRFAMADRFDLETNARIERALFEALCADPEGFIARLTDATGALRLVKGE